MIEAGDLKKGVTLRLDGNMYRVVTTAYNKPGRGTASMRTTLMDFRSGQTVQRVFPADERLENLYVDTEEVDFLYRDGDFLHFMNGETYDQYEASVSLFGDDALYLKDNLKLELRLHEGMVIDYQFPTTITYELVEAEVAVAGDTASGNLTKKAVTESGLTVQVPLFINVGDQVKIDTRDGSYVGRG